MSFGAWENENILFDTIHRKEIKKTWWLQTSFPSYYLQLFQIKQNSLHIHARWIEKIKTSAKIRVSQILARGGGLFIGVKIDLKKVGFYGMLGLTELVINQNKLGGKKQNNEKSIFAGCRSRSTVAKSWDTSLVHVLSDANSYYIYSLQQLGKYTVVHKSFSIRISTMDLYAFRFYFKSWKGNKGFVESGRNLGLRAKSFQEPRQVVGQ